MFSNEYSRFIRSLVCLLLQKVYGEITVQIDTDSRVNWEWCSWEDRRGQDLLNSVGFRRLEAYRHRQQSARCRILFHVIRVFSQRTGHARQRLYYTYVSPKAAASPRNAGESSFDKKKPQPHLVFYSILYGFLLA